VFRLIPGLRNAEFARLGGLHRNTYIDSPRLLDGTLRLRAGPNLRFAGQVTGCEGYVEASSTGLMAGLFAAAELEGRAPSAPPATTAMGALLGHITGGHLSAEEEGAPRSYQPMNVNFGLFPPPGPTPPGEGKARRGDRKARRKMALTARARADFAAWLGTLTERSAA
jgi:methylenetetrahydrofolate--tRNA-(uracil-5-)-methyltransferase